MNTENYTSLELSKRLSDAGCELRSEYWHMSGHEQLVPKQEFGFEAMLEGKLIYPAYDILNDICVEYKNKFFGNNAKAWKVTEEILAMTQMSPTKQEVEDYIWKHTLFNPKNQS